MGRRGNGEGTITRRKDGRWEARYYVPAVNGTKRKTIYGKTQAEVRDKLTKALSDRIDGIVYDDENVSVGEYLDSWLKGSVYGSVRQSTYDRDTNLVNNHIQAEPRRSEAQEAQLGSHPEFLSRPAGHGTQRLDCSQDA